MAELKLKDRLEELRRWRDGYNVNAAEICGWAVAEIVELRAEIAFIKRREAEVQKAINLIDSEQ